MEKQVNILGWDEKKAKRVSKYLEEQVSIIKQGTRPNYDDELTDCISELVDNIDRPTFENDKTESSLRQCIDTLERKKRVLDTELKNIETSIEVLRHELDMGLPF